MNRNVHRFNIILPWLFLASVYLLDLYLLIQYGRTNLDSDAASEMILASIENRDHSLMSANWYYSTEIRFIYLQGIYRIGLLLFPQNWHLARVFSGAVLLACYAVSYLFLAKNAGMKKSLAVWTCAILLIPFGWDYFEYFLFTLSYMPHVILYLMIAALVFRRMDQKDIRKQRIDSLLIFILSVIGGANGSRIFYNCVLPLAAAVIVQVLKNLIRGKSSNYQELKNQITAIRGLVPSAAALFGALAGLALNIMVFSRQYVFYNFTDAVLQEWDLSLLLKTAGSFFSLFGWQSGVSVLGFGGVSSFSGLLLAAIILSAASYLSRHTGCLSEDQKFLLSYFWCSIAVGSVFFAFSGMTNLRYWIPAVPIAIALVGVLFEKLELSPLLRRWFISLLSCLFVISSCYPIYITRRTANHSLIQAEQWLEDHDYHQGYATYWNSNVLTELSSGRILTWTVDLNTMTSRQWLEESSRETSKPEGKIFILINHKENLRGAPVMYTEDEIDEAHQNFFSSLSESHRGYEDENYSIYVFESNTELESMLEENGLPFFSPRSE